jgi:hypothetical protein
MKSWVNHIWKGFLTALGSYILLIIVGLIEGVPWNKALKIIDVKVSIWWLIGVNIIFITIIWRLWPNKFEILEAYYGIDNDINDQNVTNEVREKIQGNRLNMLASHRTLGIDDPMPNVPKRMKIRYRTGLFIKTKVFTENDMISIP